MRPRVLEVCFLSLKWFQGKFGGSSCPGKSFSTCMFHKGKKMRREREREKEKLSKCLSISISLGSWVRRQPITGNRVVSVGNASAPAEGGSAAEQREMRRHQPGQCCVALMFGQGGNAARSPCRVQWWRRWIKAVACCSLRCSSPQRSCKSCLFFSLFWPSKKQFILPTAASALAFAFGRNHYLCEQRASALTSAWKVPRDYFVLPLCKWIWMCLDVPHSTLELCFLKQRLQIDGWKMDKNAFVGNLAWGLEKPSFLLLRQSFSPIPQLF